METLAASMGRGKDVAEIHKQSGKDCVKRFCFLNGIKSHFLLPRAENVFVKTVWKMDSLYFFFCTLFSNV